MLSTVIELGKTLETNEIQQTGSTYFFGKGKDIDLLVLSNMPLESTTLKLLQNGWHTDSKEGYGDSSTWASFRKGEFNAIVHTTREEYNKMQTAAKVCKYLADLKILPESDKLLRINIHKIIRNEDVEY